MTYSKKQRKVSVIMGIYNCASTLAEAIDSLLAQTYTDWELIMCDDGSTDNTIAVAESYIERYDNILLIQNEHNMGLPATLNHCLEYAESEYIARMDGDDISLPERFAKEVDFLDTHLEYALVSCYMICFDEHGDWGQQGHKAKPEKIDFAYESPFCHAPCMMRRSVLNEVGNYTVRDTLRRGQDYYLWHKFYKAGYKGYNLQNPLYKMRDDKDAALRRRSIKQALYGMKVQAEVMHNLKLPFWLYFRCFRQVLVVMLPTCVYMKLHQKSVKSLSFKSLDNHINNEVRVLHILGSLSKGGIESFLLNINRKINRNKIKFDYVVNTRQAWQDEYANEIKQLGGRIYEFSTSVTGLKSYYRLLKKERYPIVHCQRGEMSTVFLTIAKWAGVKTRIAHSHTSKSGHSGIEDKVGRLLAKRLPYVATDLLACGDEAGKYLYGNHPYKVVYNAIDAKAYIADKGKGNRLKEQLGISEKTLVFGHVGRIEEAKNHRFLMDIFYELLKTEPDSILLCAGEGSLREAIEEYAQQIGVYEKTKFLGNRSDIADLLQCIDCIIFPSLYEGFSVAMVEMQAASVPVLASTAIPKEISVIPELLCFVSLNEPAEVWAEKAVVMARDNVKCNRYEAIVQAGLDAQALADRMENYYLNCLSN